MRRSAVSIGLLLMAYSAPAGATNGPGTEPPPPGQPPLACTNGGMESGVPPLLQSVVKNSDPAHKGHLHLANQPGDRFPFPACGVPNPIPPVVEPELTFHYKAFRFKNRSLTESCVTAELLYYQCGVSEPCPPEITCQGDVASGICGGVGFREVTVYLGSFDPNDIRKNFIADATRIAAGPGRDQVNFTVPSLADFILVVRAPERGETVGNGLGFDPYFDLWVTGCGQHVVTRVTPNSGSEAGGTTVRIEGSGFSRAQPVTVDIGNSAKHVVVLDDSTISAVTAPTAQGTYDVKVRSLLNGQTITSLMQGAFTYEPVDAAVATVRDEPEDRERAQPPLVDANPTPSRPRGSAHAKVTIKGCSMGERAPGIGIAGVVFGALALLRRCSSRRSRACK